MKQQITENEEKFGIKIAYVAEVTLNKHEQWLVSRT